MEDQKKVNLPKTKFSMKANLSQREPVQAKNWEAQDLYGKMLAKNKNNKHYILHDGPPYANGHIHLGHALNKILKDIIIKYESMNGSFTPYIPGWDCHGLPIEYQLLKEMNTDKNHVDQLKFRKKAGAFAQKFIKIQRDEFKRLGILGDWENPYLTMDPKYEAVIVRMFKELAKKGYVYRGKKPVYWCRKCETALAEAEVEYADHTSPSVFVKFPVKDSKLNDIDNLFVIIWTTTPWTLPANVAVAFHEKFDYVIFEVTESGKGSAKAGERYIVADELKDNVCRKCGIKAYKELKKVKGKDLEGLTCKSPFRDEFSQGVCADFVTLEDGTGIVHIAPGHGEDDYKTALKYNLPIVTPVDDKGCFTDDVALFAGKEVFSCNPLIIEYLIKNSLLIGAEDINHSYPHCWRCKEPIVFRATDQWFLDIDKDGLREALKKACADVKWIPEFGYNRITGMIENRPHWCLSRQRLWGTPIPVFYCEDCRQELLTEESVEAVASLFEQKGSDAWFYMNAGEILPEHITCSCGGKKFRKETDILDVWFDSGVSHEAVLKQREGLSWPADLYLEGSDQHRGWFQTSLIPSVALYNRAPYKTVLTHGFTVDGEGKKMSKSQGNVIAPQEIMDKYGADIIRLWVSSENYREDVRVSDDIITQLVDAYRKIRNTARYILGNLNEYDHENHACEYKDMLEIDKWVLFKLAELTKTIQKAYEEREFHIVYRKFYNFCTIELSSLYFDILKDRLYVLSPKSKERRSAQTALYYIATWLTRLIAPVLSFTAEEIWECIPGSKQESVFLQDFTGINSFENDLLKQWESCKESAQKWDEMFEFRKIVLKKIEEKRQTGIIGNSLEARVVLTINKEYKGIYLDKGHETLWAMALIVSQVEIIVKEDVAANIDSEILSDKLKGFHCNINVIKAEGKKCERCWNWSTTVGNDKENPSLCSRCSEIIKNW
ncbi:MAG: isoleucine--tRNA ligase [Elusimicrobiota bacterium]